MGAGEALYSEFNGIVIALSEQQQQQVSGNHTWHRK